MADYRYITNTGVIVPDTAATLEEVRDEFRSAFGQDLDVSSETPQGVLITGETIARDNVIKNNAALANQINPNEAGGIFLDAIWALTGGGRVKATPSIVRGVVMTGRPSTVIPALSQASAGINGAIFELISAVIIDNDGQATGDFQCTELGPVAVAVNGLDTIVTGVLGWETVSNPVSAEPGRADEKDQAARLRRRKTLALQGVALPEAIISGLYDSENVPGVKSLSFVENVTNAPLTVEGVTLVPHSIYVCVDGGNDTDIATALLRKKSLGCGWNGHVTVNVTEPVSGQVYPVKFDRPSYVQIYAKVYVRSVTAVSNPEQAVRDAILSYANGDMEGEEGFVVGGDVSPFELAGAVNRTTPTLFVWNVLCSTDGVTYSPVEIPIKINQKATILSGAIEVVVS